MLSICLVRGTAKKKTPLWPYFPPFFPYSLSDGDTRWPTIRLMQWYRVSSQTYKWDQHISLACNNLHKACSVLSYRAFSGRMHNSLHNQTKYRAGGEKSLCHWPWLGNLGVGTCLGSNYSLWGYTQHSFKSLLRLEPVIDR
jgi:hypothetical protein